MSEPVERQGERDSVLEQWRLRVRTLEAQLAQVERERDLFAAGIRGYEEIELAIRNGDLTEDEGLDAYRAHTGALADQGASDE